MKTDLSLVAPSQIETECLVVVVLDRGQKDKPEPSLETTDNAVRSAAADVIKSGEVTGKIFETVMLHRPQGLKAKRLLMVGGGKAANFSGYELRKLAGTAARFLKPKNIRSFAMVAPENWGGKADPASQSTYVFERGGAPDAVKSIVEGVFVGNFDPDTYKSDRKDQTVQSLTVVASGDQAALQQAMDQARIVAESPRTRQRAQQPHDPNHTCRAGSEDG